jgi:hypothetical protein
MPNPELANVVETVIMLRYVELRSQLYRLLSIMKMRESAYDTSIREFQITDRGLRVAESFASAEAILTGHARRPGVASGGEGSESRAARLGQSRGDFLGGGRCPSVARNANRTGLDSSGPSGTGDTSSASEKVVRGGLRDHVGPSRLVAPVDPMSRGREGSKSGIKIVLILPLRTKVTTCLIR